MMKIHRPFRTISCFIVFVAFFLIPPTLPGRSASLDTTVVPSAFDQILISSTAGGQVMQPALALDSQNNYHLAYTEWQNGLHRVVYASYNPITTALTEDPLPHTTDEWLPDVIVDRFDNIHLFYVRRNVNGYGDIIHTTGSPGSWVHTAITTTDFLDELDPSAAVDAFGGLHVAYARGTMVADSDIYYATNTSGIWIEEQVTNNADYDFYPALAVDGNGYAHIVYMSDDNILYATNTTGSWENIQVNSYGFDNRNPSIAVDAGGYVHIAYRKGELVGQPSSPLYSVVYIHNKYGSWSRNTVDGPWDASAGADSKAHISLNPHGKVYVTYMNPEDQEVYVAVQENDFTWQHTLVSQDAFFQPQAINGRSVLIDHWDRIIVTYTQNGIPPNVDLTNTILAISKQPVTPRWDGYPVGESNIDGLDWEITMNLDYKRFPHITYYRPQFQSLHTEYIDAGTGLWLGNFLDVSEDVGRYHDLVLINNDIHDYAFYNATSSNLLYLPQITSLFEIIDTGGDVGKYVNCTQNYLNRHCSYYDATNGDLKYAKASYPSGAWSPETVESEGNVGLFTSIDLGASDYPHIAYYDMDNAALKHAYYNGSTWITETVDSNLPHYGYDWDISLKVGWDGYPQIAYYDAFRTSLKHAQFDGSQWITATIDNNGDVGQYNAIDLDRYNHAHIAYYDWYAMNLKYVRWDGITWHYKWVDTVGSVGWYVDMVLDPLMDLPHFAYFDATNNKVMYAYTYLYDTYVPMMMGK